MRLGQHPEQWVVVGCCSGGSTPAGGLEGQEGIHEGGGLGEVAFYTLVGDSVGEQASNTPRPRFRKDESE